MKSVIIFGFLSLATVAVHAQHIYYVEENAGMEVMLKKELLDAKQNVINTVVGSDYILKTTYTTLSPNQFTVRMSVIDSLTYKPVLEDNENYFLKKEHKNMRAALWLAFQAMMEKNISKMLQAVEMNRFQARESKLNKDKR